MAHPCLTRGLQCVLDLGLTCLAFGTRHGVCSVLGLRLSM